MDFFDWFDDDLELEDFALIGGLLGEIENEKDEKREGEKVEPNLFDLDESNEEKEDEFPSVE